MNYEIVCFLEQNASKHWTVVDKKKMKVFYYIDKEKSNLKIRIKPIATSASQESSEPLYERLYSLTQLKKQLDPASSDSQMELEELALELINKITGQTGVLKNEIRINYQDQPQFRSAQVSSQSSRAPSKHVPPTKCKPCGMKQDLCSAVQELPLCTPSKVAAA